MAVFLGAGFLSWPAASLRLGLGRRAWRQCRRHRACEASPRSSLSASSRSLQASPPRRFSPCLAIVAGLRSERHSAAQASPGSAAFSAAPVRILSQPPPAPCITRWLSWRTRVKHRREDEREPGIGTRTGRRAHRRGARDRLFDRRPVGASLWVIAQAFQTARITHGRPDRTAPAGRCLA